MKRKRCQAVKKCRRKGNNSSRMSLSRLQLRISSGKKCKVLERHYLSATSLIRTCTFFSLDLKKKCKVLERRCLSATSLRTCTFFLAQIEKNFKVLEQRCLAATSLQRPLRFLKHQGQIVDQRLTLNESQRKTALTITTPRSSTRSFANDLAPRLSTRGLTPTRDDACRVPEGQRVDSVTARRPSSFVCRGRGTNASSLLGGILT